MGGGGNIYEKARSAAGTLPGYAWGMFETLFKINKAEKKDRRAANNLKKLRQRVLLPIWIGFPNMHKAKAGVDIKRVPSAFPHGVAGIPDHPAFEIKILETTDAMHPL